MLKDIFRILDKTLCFVEDWTLFISVSAALLAAFANVVLRKLTSDVSLFWSDEVVRKVIFFSTYIGCVAAIRSRALIRIDALPQLVPILKKPLTLLSHLAVLVFAGMMIKFGTNMMLAVRSDEYARTATLQIPEWYFYLVLPVMGVMMFLRTLIVAIEDWRGDAPGSK